MALDRRFSRTTLAVFALLASGGAPSGVHAQPPATESPSASEVAAAETAWAALRQEVQTLQITEPRATVKKLESFYDKQGYKSGTVAVELTSLVAQIYYQELGDRDKALELYDWGIKTFNVPGTARLEKERQIVENDAPVIVPTVTVDLAEPTAFAVPKDIGPQPMGHGQTVAVVDALPQRTAGTAGSSQVAVPSPVTLAASPMSSVVAALRPVSSGVVAGAVPAIVASARQDEILGQIPPKVNAGPVASSVTAVKIETLPAMHTAGTSSGGALTVKALRATAVTFPSAAPADLPRASPATPLALAATTPKIPHSAASVPSPVTGAGAMLANSSFWLQLQAAPQDAEVFWTNAPPRGEELLTHLETASENTPERAAFRLALAGLLAKHGEEFIKDTVKLTAAVRLALADYYASEQDDKAIPLYEGLLADIKKNGVKDAWVVELDKLADFYQNGGEHAKAAELLENVDQYTSRSSMRGNLKIKAARLYRAAGEVDKALALYQKVIDTPSDWGFARGLAIHDKASILIDEGKHEEARRLLETPVSGEQAELTRPTILDLLGFSYFETGDYDKARLYTEQSLAVHDRFKNQLKPVRQGTLTEAQVRLKTLDEWKTKAFESPLKASSFDAGADDGYHARIDIRSLKPQSFVVRFDDEKVSLVGMKLLSRRRLDSGITNEVYDLTYKTAVHPKSVRARIVSNQEPREEHVIDIVLGIEGGQG